MRRLLLAMLTVGMTSQSLAVAQIGVPGVNYSTSIAAGEGGQLYPYDQQDPWIHGQYQRVPAYGGFASFRPYNYRHVFSQTQIATNWGDSHGMPYSQQFWNKYRGSYLQGNLHSQAEPAFGSPVASSQGSMIYKTAYSVPAQPRPIHQTAGPLNTVPHDNGRPVHVFPPGVSLKR